MTPIKKGKYEFRPSSLIKLRQDMKLKQKTMAQMLDIPANTLSRWETGSTTPDAEALAAIHSLAKERGATPEFFQRRKLDPKPSKGRSRLIVTWDFQQVGVYGPQLEDMDSFVRSQLNKRFPQASYRLLKAFAWESQSEQTDLLDELGWKVFEDDDKLVHNVFDDAKSDCGQEPEDTTFVLIAKDDVYDELIKELKERRVQVYLMTPPGPNSEVLAAAVPKKRRIVLPEHYSYPTIVNSIIRIGFRGDEFLGLGPKEG